MCFVLILSFIPLSFVFWVENHWQAPVTTKNQHSRLVHWNIMWGQLGWHKVQQEILSQDAEINVLSETSMEHVAELSHRLQANFIYLNRGKIAMVAAGDIDVLETVEFRRGCIAVVRYSSNQYSLKLLLVDLPSSIFNKRFPILAKVNSIIDRTKPDLVVGDFNSPRRSIALSELPDGYRHAYDAVGSGWSYTWPSIIPLWSIDHCIIGPQIEPENYIISRSFYSDHSRQLLGFSFKQR